MSRDPSRYLVDGRRVPSVSRVLRIAGLVDLSGIPEAVLEKARQRGQAVHAWIDGMNQGYVDGEPLDDEIAGYVAGYESFLADTSAVVEASELSVVSKVYGFAGQLDLLATIGTTPWLLDIKATASVPPEAALQTAAYRLAHGEPRSRGVLHLKPDGRYALVEHKNHREDEHDFLAALRVTLWRLRNGLSTLED